ncbi:deoxynucleoside monophosphate kinase [Streptomyces phage Annadreamy]|uniref:Deoxynucleoside monophosphate kinase n=2 Tax=Annadreamyvirus annadreamy TaxID=2846392 RepID=A0A345GTC7_9CAUD|nr:deoxynucleoside monophosphate kinase [Streptomyces phage Annadreamy]AXG66199.1 deoxynucleoside monophosphate kinase [Streptomyces phage Annadreamy]QGH79412.1 deoxynucleoside monophosphate kinase [Streptomyces phage Limpid]
MIIGLAGYARSGKDSAADALQSVGFRRIAFADKLREFVYALNPEVDGGPMGVYPLKEIIDQYGWGEYKNTYWGDSIREQLQFIGTDCVRNILGPDTWVNATFNAIDFTQDYVITDVRFPNEAEGIREKGGLVYRVLREGVGPANGHYSEVALDDFPFDDVILNYGTLTEFHENVRSRFVEGRN